MSHEQDKPAPPRRTRLFTLVAAFLVNASHAQIPAPTPVRNTEPVVWVLQVPQDPAELADLNGDGYITDEDLHVLMMILAEPPDPGPETRGTYKRHIRGDINADGLLNDADVTLFLEVMAEANRPRGCAQGVACCSLPVKMGGCCGDPKGPCTPAKRENFVQPKKRTFWRMIKPPIDVAALPPVTGIPRRELPRVAIDDAKLSELRRIRVLPPHYKFGTCELNLPRLETLDDIRDEQIEWLLSSHDAHHVGIGIHLAHTRDIPELLIRYAHLLSDEGESVGEGHCGESVQDGVVVAYRILPTTVRYRIMLALGTWFQSDIDSEEHFQSLIPAGVNPWECRAPWLSMISRERRRKDPRARESLRERILALDESLRWSVLAEASRYPVSTFDKEFPPLFTPDEAYTAFLQFSDDLRLAILEERAPIPPDVRAAALRSEHPSEYLRPFYYRGRYLLVDPSIGRSPPEIRR